MRTLVTGYAGFIGSNLTRMLLSELSQNDEVMGLDAMTYAARPRWALSGGANDKNFFMVHVDLRDANAVMDAIDAFRPDRVYHLAAESHVCRSIEGPRAFAETNFMGTFNLLEALRNTGFKGRMVHVSTDEAFGELRIGDEPFDESSVQRPNSPYSASKCASDMMARAYVHTYGMDIVTTRCSNNYGPNQHYEKLIPRTIMRFLDHMPMTVHGDGSNMRDWIYVDDHCRALIAAMENGMPGHLYCIGAGLELTNRDVIKTVSNVLFEDFDWKGSPELIFTDDRPTDDRRYALRTDRIQQLGWRPQGGYDYFRRNVAKTVKWYLEEDR